MPHSTLCTDLPARWVAVLCLLACLVGTRPLFAARPPTTAEVKAIVEEHLRSNTVYVPGDLISRKDVEPIFDKLIELGVPLSAGQEELYDDFVPDHSHLAQMLRSRQGRTFMQKVKSVPGIYDRLERLSWNTKGRELLEMLIGDSEGAEILKLMLERAGKAVMAKYLSDDPNGKKFLIPTGHIHTASELLKRLETVVSPKAKK